MLVKIDDGFYLNSPRIVSVRVLKHPHNESFKVVVDYQGAGNMLATYPKYVANKELAEAYLQHIHHSLYALNR